MSSQAFKAQVAVGSWARAPFWPGMSKVTKIIESEMGDSDKAQASQAGADIVEDSESSDSDF
jgi:hypothetical protein